MTLEEYQATVESTFKNGVITGYKSGFKSAMIRGLVIGAGLMFGFMKLYSFIFE